MSKAIKIGDVLTVATEGRQEHHHYLHIGDRVIVREVMGRPRQYLVYHEGRDMSQVLCKKDFYPPNL